MFGRGAAAGAFGDVEDDTEGGAFELVAEVALAFIGDQGHDADMEAQGDLVNIERFM